MMRLFRKTATLIAATTMAGGVLLSVEKIPSGGAFVSSAEARVGRPRTPMSYAGVARRTTRRAVAVGAAGAAAYGAYGASGCRRVVNAYGHTVTRCY